MPEKQAAQITTDLLAFIERAVVRAGGSTSAVNPGHRVRFHWPPEHPVSYGFQIGPDDFTDRAAFHAHGETFEVKVAHTEHGVFGRCEAIWHEARGGTLHEMLMRLRESAEPLFARQLCISDCLERTGRFHDHLRDLPPLDLLKLLYCSDRDVAAEAQLIIEAQASSRLFLPALLAILRDRRHPHRRSAQWCVLDLFEALPTFQVTETESKEAVAAVRDLLWDAQDDYARAIFKAGVVLGGHLTTSGGAEALLDCLEAPSRIGRRAAIHGLYHVVEWCPERKAEVVEAIERLALVDGEPLLREYAARMARDIDAADPDHVLEPAFPGE